MKEAQSELKRLNLFSAEINGIAGPQTRAAIKEFQVRHGIKPTGELDARTLQRLQKAAAAASGKKEAQQGGAGTSSSSAPASDAKDRTQEMIESDQQFLHQIESLNRLPAPSPAPAANASGRGAAAPVGEQQGPKQTRPAAAPPRITQDGARHFAERYLKVAEGPNPSAEAACYAGHVDYFADGRVSRDHVERDQAIYYKRWPKRRFSLVGKPEVVDMSDSAATVRFRVRYDLKGPNESNRGETEQAMRIAQTPDGVKIIGIRERKLPVE